MKTKKRLIEKVVATVLSVILCTVAFAGCSKKIYITSGLSDNEVFKVGGQSCSVGQMNIILLSQKQEYESVFDENVWTELSKNASLEEKVKEQTLENMMSLYCIKAMAKNDGIELNLDENNKVRQAAETYFNSLSASTVETLKITLEDVTKLYTDFMIAIKLYNSYTSGVQVEISDSTARVIKVQSIFLKTYEIDENKEKVSYNEEKIKEVRTTAHEILMKINEGNDFSTLAARYSDDENIQYIFGRGEMIEAYENAAFELTTGQVSSILETEDGFYIIKCLSDYLEVETAKDKEDIVDAYKRDAFMEKFKPFKKTLLQQVNNSLWASFTMDVKDVDISGFYETFFDITE